MSLWDSLDAVRGFAGDDVEKAVFYPEDERFLVDRELTSLRRTNDSGRGMPRPYPSELSAFSSVEIAAQPMIRPIKGTDLVPGA
jgi:hypothetical protein